MIFDSMCQIVSPIMDQIHKLPFNIELSNGTLAKEVFIFYLAQDVIYLSDFSRALLMIAAKLPDNQLIQQFAGFAQEALSVERELHLNYLQTHPLEKPLLTEPTPSCFMYTSYLLKMAGFATIEEAVASLLPCFWVYHEVGKKIALSCNSRDNPYLEWINLYSSKEFYSSVQTAVQALNQLSTTSPDKVKENMVKAFTQSTKLEWLFWNSAYHQEKWLV